MIPAGKASFAAPVAVSSALVVIVSSLSAPRGF